MMWLNSASGWYILLKTSSLFPFLPPFFFKEWIGINTTGMKMDVHKSSHNILKVCLGLKYKWYIIVNNTRILLKMRIEGKERCLHIQQ